MNRRSKANLLGAIRLVGIPSSIGIPVFGCRDLNHCLVPEMDGEFRITRFLDFYNDNEYEVVSDTSTVPGKNEFSIGDHAPIPFWYQDRLYAVGGNAYPQELLDTFGANAGRFDVISDLVRILDDARHGRITQRLDSWRVDDLRALFHDIFYDPPAHSRFWVSRFKVAVANIRSKTQPSKVIDSTLQETAYEWLRKFASKTDYARIRMILGDPADGLFSSYEIVDSLFAFCTHKLALGGHAEVSRVATSNPEFARLFPEGLYFHYIKHDYSYGHFDYQKLGDYLQPLRELILKGLQTYMLKDARRLSVALFGQRDAPANFAEFIMGPRKRLLDDFHTTMDTEIYTGESGQDISKRMRGEDDEYLLSLQKAIRQYDAMRDLEGIEFADSRLVTTRKDFMGIRQETIEDLRMTYKGRER